MRAVPFVGPASPFPPLAGKRCVLSRTRRDSQGRGGAGGLPLLTRARARFDAAAAAQSGDRPSGLLSGAHPRDGAAQRADATRLVFPGRYPARSAPARATRDTCDTCRSWGCPARPARRREAPGARSDRAAGGGGARPALDERSHGDAGRNPRKREALDRKGGSRSRAATWRSRLRRRLARSPSSRWRCGSRRGSLRTSKKACACSARSARRRWRSARRSPSSCDAPLGHMPRGRPWRIVIHESARCKEAARETREGPIPVSPEELAAAKEDAEILDLREERPRHVSRGGDGFL